MPGTTSGLGLRYALLADPANAQSGFQHLAEDTESWLAPLFAYKDSDESVSSATTYQNDDHLILSLPANRIYVLDAFIQYFAQDNSTVPDLKFRFAFPSGGSIAFGRMCANAGTTGVNSTSVDFSSTVGFDTSSPTSNMVAGAMGLAATLLIRGVVRSGTTGGTLTFQWAQNSSSGNAIVVQAGSYIHLRRVA